MISPRFMGSTRTEEGIPICSKTKLLVDSGIVSESLVKKPVSPDQADFLFEVIEPLEEALDPRYDPSTFDASRRVFRKDDISDEKKW